MKHLLEFKNYQEGNYTFQDVFPGIKDEWMELNFSERSRLRNEIFEIIDGTYRSVFDEGHFRVKNPDSIINDESLTFWSAVDIDGDPKTDIVIFGSERYIDGRSTGYKISGWGHDGSRESKRTLLDRLSIMLKDRDKNFWIEVSDAPARILTHHNFNVPVVPRDKAEKLFPESTFEWIDNDPEFNGFYIRTLLDGKKTEKEILLGNPSI